MKFNNPYWTALEKIQLLQRWILFHSVAYYELDMQFVTDSVFDANCKQLVSLMKDNEYFANKSTYKHLFIDFDGNTGFHLVNELKSKECNKKLYDKILYDISIAGRIRGDTNETCQN